MLHNSIVMVLIIFVVNIIYVSFSTTRMILTLKVFIAKLKCRDVQNFYANGYAEGLYMEG
ncbi:hypothetical protein KNH48_13260 [Heyndrickxia coagulans]|nr:hypothetical protein KNH48_13260 [Heyndrickxia coagulans]